MKWTKINRLATCPCEFLGEHETIQKIELSSTNSKFKMEVKVCSQFGAFFVEIIVQVFGEETPTTVSAEQSAFSVLMSKAKERGRPSKIDPVKNSVDKICNDLLEYLGELDIDWSVSLINTTGNTTDL